MGTIGRLNYMITADAGSFIGTAVATRREQQALKKLFLESRTDAELYTAQVAGLESMYQRGVATQEAYVRGLRAIRNTLPEVIESQRLANDSARRWSEFVDSSRPPLVRYEQGVARLRSALGSGDIDQATFRNALQGLRLELASGIPVVGQYAGLLAGGPLTLGAYGVAAGIAAITAAVTAGVAAFVLINRTAIETLGHLDQIADQSRVIGISAESYHELSIAADLADVSQEKLSSGFRRLLVTVADAAAGGTESAAAFRAIGLDARELILSSPEEMFRRVVRAMADVPTTAQKLNLGRDIFGKGSDEISLLAGSLAEASDQARELTDAAGTIDWAAVDQFDQSAKELAQTLQLTKDVAASQLAPELSALADEAIELLRDDGTKNGLKLVILSTAEAVKTLRLALAETKPFADGMLKALASATFSSDMLAAGREHGKELKERAELFQGIGTFVEKMTKPFGDVPKPIDAEAIRAQLGDADHENVEKPKAAAKDDALQVFDREMLAAQKEAMSLLLDVDAAEQMRLEFDGMDPAMARLVVQAKAANRELREMADLKKDADKVKESLRTPAEKAAIEEDRLRKMFDAGLLGADAFEESLMRLRKQLQLDVNVEFHGVDAVEAGTREAAAIVNRYRDQLANGDFVPPKALNLDGVEQLPDVKVKLDDQSDAQFERMVAVLEEIRDQEVPAIELQEVGAF